ncbi:MAG: hypothetical protein RMM17_10300 [Acidobacteriota bacterium]|nr:hypothetical protein [Blastocatellia bacterium]MDW8413060.1 hypothetical protein [Acidobacteriota bacterium]
MKFFAQLWVLWKKLALTIGYYQTRLILTLIYFLIIPIFTLIKLKDPLRKRHSAPSWLNRLPESDIRQSFKRMF